MTPEYRQLTRKRILSHSPKADEPEPTLYGIPLSEMDGEERTAFLYFMLREHRRLLGKPVSLDIRSNPSVVSHEPC
jgi:hypothetical protein